MLRPPSRSFHLALVTASLVSSVGLALALGCSGESENVSEILPAEPTEAGARAFASDMLDVPIQGLEPATLSAFFRGDELFATAFRESDGLGPVYVRASCTSCHASALRGPGGVEKFVLADRDGEPLEDQSALLFGHDVRPLVAARGKTPVTVPSLGALFDGGTPSGIAPDAGPADHSIRRALRVGPPLLALGYIEAISEAEIVRIAKEQCARGDGVCGTIHYVGYRSKTTADPRFHVSTPNSEHLVGRFGVKARVAYVDDFVAEALVGDLGLTSPLRPRELPNPDGLSDDNKPGIDVTVETVQALATYIRTVALPRRPQVNLRGYDAFSRAQCSACHVPSMRTRTDYPIVQLANIDAAVYTDLLLHDMGTGLDDGVPDGPRRHFRTAPLVGVRFQRSYLHDGRAKTIEEAIAAHDSDGSEARNSARAFAALTPDERASLVQFLKGL